MGRDKHGHDDERSLRLLFDSLICLTGQPWSKAGHDGKEDHVNRCTRTTSLSTSLRVRIRGARHLPTVGATVNIASS
jgi:hypothetical protein